MVCCVEFCKKWLKFKTEPFRPIKCLETTLAKCDRFFARPHSSPAPFLPKKTKKMAVMLSTLFAQLELTEFLPRIEAEGFASSLDILELSDEELKGLAADVGMKRGHIVR
jgi:hypothetical protein